MALEPQGIPRISRWPAGCDSLSSMRFRGCQASLPAALTLLFIGCGGRAFDVGSVEPGDGGGGGDAELPIDAGSGDGSDAGQPIDGAGSPDGGTDGDASGTCPIPATISNGAACTTEGLDCTSAAPIYTCGTGQVTGYAACACTAAHWVCPEPTCMEAGAPPPPACPAPKLVHEGVVCDMPGEDCPGDPTMCNGPQTFYDVFQCTKLDVWTRIVATACGDGG